MVKKHLIASPVAPHSRVGIASGEEGEQLAGEEQGRGGSLEVADYQYLHCIVLLLCQWGGRVSRWLGGAGQGREPRGCSLPILR